MQTQRQCSRDGGGHKFAPKYDQSHSSLRHVFAKPMQCPPSAASKAAHFGCLKKAFAAGTRSRR
jgi:hypothetical protein